LPELQPNIKGHVFLRHSVYIRHVQNVMYIHCGGLEEYKAKERRLVDQS